MNPYRDRDQLRQISQRRATSDLLRWSMGRKPRYGRDFVEYEAPTNPASPPPTLASVVASIRAWFRDLGIGMLRTVLIWFLSFEKDERRD